MPPQKRVLKKTGTPTSATQPEPGDDLEDGTNEDPNLEGDITDPETEDGNSGSGDDETEEVTAAPQSAEDLVPMRGAPRDGRTYRVGQKVVFKGRKVGGMIVSEENIYRGTLRADESRWRFRLLLGKGSEVPAGKTRVVKDGNGEYSTDQENLF